MEEQTKREEQKAELDKEQKRLDAKLNEPHVIIRIFEDGQVFATNDKNQVLPVDNPRPDFVWGPKNTYDQAMWYCGSPIWVWIRGKRRCFGTQCD